ncbi:MAG TPA: sigma-70 family RNA polymerase sigma factor [Acidobacteriota bacterium]|nr:sigma-70 family RNA polymerase sigma factor [Acidobacteriota bacterium]
MSRSEKKEEALQTAAALDTPASGPDMQFEQVFRDHNRTVFRAAYRVTGNPSDAEDVMQTVFMRLLKREGALDLGENPAGYLHRAAVNAAIDLLRSRKSSASISLEDVVFPPPDDTPGPEQKQMAAEIRRWLRQAIANLSENAAEMFVLRYFEGYGNQEIAEMLGTSQGTVAVTLHRTRSRLQQEIGKILKRN